MTTSTDAANIVYCIAKQFGMPVYHGFNMPIGFLEPEGRIVIHSREQTAERVWLKNFVEVNFLLPDIAEDRADLVGLNGIERLVKPVFSTCGKHDGAVYRIRVYSTNVSQDKELKAHYLNVKLLFSSINTTD